ncbi:MAG: alpha/beta hydrolase [Firmicutes bacterium]|nr:alpha/beta hydrolase [Bacillota bacterium]
MFKVLSKALVVAAVIIGLGFAATLPFYWHDLSEVNQVVASNAKIIDSPYGAIEYLDAGAGQPVLVSHGTMGGYDHGLLMARSVMGNHYRFIIPSRFGYLNSEMPSDASFEAQADSYAYLLEQLHIDHVVVQGMSAGGVPAIQFAIRHPEKTSGLLLMSTIAYAPKAEVEPQKLPIPVVVYKTILKSDYLFWALLKTSPSSVHNIFGASPEIKAGSNEEELRLLDNISWTLLPVSKRYNGWANDGQNIAKLSEMPLQNIKVPTLFFSALDDTIAPYSWSSYTAQKIPDSRLITLQSGGHVLLGHIDEVREKSVQFIEKCFNS